MAKKQKLKSSLVEHTKSSAKKRIKKSDDIIVVAKTPIEEIIKQTKGAKEVKKAIKKLRKKEENIEKKVKDVKKKKIIDNDLYTQSKRLIQNTYSSQVYCFKHGKIDYGALFSYLSEEKKNIEVMFSEYEKAVVKQQEFQRDELGEKKIVQEHNLMSYLGRFMLNKFNGQDMNDISVEEKERFNNYAMFNKVWIMMKISLLGLGEKTYHAFHTLEWLNKK